ncbi:MAG: alpha/beta hydrolase [Phaeodactylibacter sp.]|nr:alpha/beta hydrolase [Phaeodactylibacter sp.]
MPQAFLHTPHGDVYYLKLGNGPRLLLAFHGFGADSSVFQCMGPLLQKDCTLYAIDLPFHGKTVWKESGFFPKQLESVVHAILQCEGKERFEAIGHSLGGRLWLSLLARQGHRLDALYLLAPDGLQTRWMGLAGRLPLFMRQLIGRLATRPEKGLALARILRRRGLVDDFVMQYLRYHLKTSVRRRRLLDTWYALSHFPMNTAKARSLLGSLQAPTLVLLGKRDTLAPATQLRRALSGLPNVDIREADAGHQDICRWAAPFILNAGRLRQSGS